jgi:predicted nucleic acid-binding protein
MFLLDTNIISELRKGNRTHPMVADWSKSVRHSDQHLSVVTGQELEFGALRLEARDSVQFQVLANWLHHEVIPHFSSAVLEIDVSIALQAARLYVTHRRNDRDILIAATALVHDMTVVTRNVSDFAGTGVRLLNPFEANPKEAIA